MAASKDTRVRVDVFSKISARPRPCRRCFSCPVCRSRLSCSARSIRYVSSAAEKSSSARKSRPRRSIVSLTHRTLAARRRTLAAKPRPYEGSLAESSASFFLTSSMSTSRTACTRFSNAGCGSAPAWEYRTTPSRIAIRVGIELTWK